MSLAIRVSPCLLALAIVAGSFAPGAIAGDVIADDVIGDDAAAGDATGDVERRPVDVAVGFARHAHLGRWTAIDATGYDTVEAADPLGNRVVYPGGPNALIQLGRAEGEIRLTGPGGSRSLATGDTGSQDVTTLAESISLVAATGQQTGLAEAVAAVNAKPVGATRLMLLAVAPDEIPSDPARLAELDYLFWNAPPPTPEQSDALRKWVAAGGRLTLSLGDGDWAQSAVWDWIDATVEPKSYDSFSELLTVVPKARRVRVPRGREARGWSVQTQTGQVLSGTLLVRQAVGFGLVNVLGVDVATREIASWDGLSELHFLLAGHKPSNSLDRERLSKTITRTGVTDLTSQLIAEVDRVDQVRTPTTWNVLGWVVLYAILIGPVDYLLVHRVLRRPTLTWLTLPLWVVAGLIGSEILLRSQQATNDRATANAVVDDDGEKAAGSADPAPASTLAGPRGRSLQLIDIDQTRGRGRSIEIAAVHYDDLGRYTVRGQSPPGFADATVRTGWLAPLEANFGGLYHRGGLSIAGGRYEASAELDALLGRPVVENGAILVQTLAEGDAGTAIESGLVLQGRYPNGAVTNRLPSAISDWFLAFGRVMVRPRDGEPLRPGRPFEMDRLSVQVSGLRDSLVGLSRTEVAKQNQKGERVVVNRETYDALSRDLATAVTTATFYTVAGGEEFAEVTNAAAYDFDLSELLPLDRAVLIGRLDTTGQPSTLTDAAGEPIPLVARDTFVRVLLPLDRPDD